MQAKMKTLEIRHKEHIATDRRQYSGNTTETPKHEHTYTPCSSGCREKHNCSNCTDGGKLAGQQQNTDT